MLKWRELLCNIWEVADRCSSNIDEALVIALHVIFTGDEIHTFKVSLTTNLCILSKWIFQFLPLRCSNGDSNSIRVRFTNGDMA